MECTVFPLLYITKEVQIYIFNAFELYLRVIISKYPKLAQLCTAYQSYSKWCNYNIWIKCLRRHCFLHHHRHQTWLTVLLSPDVEDSIVLFLTWCGCVGAFMKIYKQKQNLINLRSLLWKFLPLSVALQLYLDSEQWQSHHQSAEEDGRIPGILSNWVAAFRLSSRMWETWDKRLPFTPNPPACSCAFPP